jgi:hypothetical protein
VEEGRLAYRVRTAEASDAAALRDAIGTTLAHPGRQGRRESYSGAASRGDILVLERYDRAAQHWQVAGFVECHMRVDDNLSIRDIGTTGDEPPTGVVRYLLDQAFNSFRPVESQVKIRRDATVWLDIFRNTPGFYLEGEEYRRPHYWTIWRWDRQRARDDERPAQPAAGQSGQRPRPPRMPTQWAGGGTAAGAAPAPRNAGPPDRNAGPPQRNAGPPQRNAGPPDRNASPLDRNAGPLDRNAGPPDRNAGPLDRNASPPDRNAGPPQRAAGPPLRNAGPPARGAGPPARTGSPPPPRGAGSPPRGSAPPARGPRPGGPSGPSRPAGPNGPARPSGPRANRPPGRPSRPAKPR